MAHMNTFDGEVTGNEPISNRDRYLTSKKALQIIEHEESIRARERFEHDARMEKVEWSNTQIRENEREDASNENHPKPSAAVTKRCAALREKLAAEKAAASKGKGYSDSAANYLDDFVRTLKRPTRDASTFQELAPGKTIAEMFEAQRSLLVQGQIHLKHAQNANATREVAEKQICDGVDKFAGRLTGKECRRHGETIKWPMQSFWNGRAFDTTIDTNEVLFSLFGEEIKAKLIARAMADFDDSTGLTTMQRAAAIKEAQEEIARAEYLSEFWYREARKAGVSIGPRLTSNPLAILDIEYV